MKKIQHIICLTLIIFVAICQINNKVLAYTLEEVKEMIEYKTVAEDGEPEKFDLLIDSSLLKDVVEFPCIKVSLETILFDTDGVYGLLNTNFFKTTASSSAKSKTKTNATTTDTEESGNNYQNIGEKIGEIVRNLYKIFLYIAVAIMLTLLIYIGVLLSSSSLSNNVNLPFGEAVSKQGNGPKEQIRKKSLIEQWIISFILLVLMVYLINLTLSFSNFLMNLANSNNPNKKNNNSIIIYVADLRGKEDTSNIDTTNAYYFKTGLEGLMMFQTQFKWEDNAVRNIANMISGITVTLFKFMMDGLFIVRMMLLAVLIMVAPLVVVINGFYRVSGNKGILHIWLKIFLYSVFLRPVVGILYYLLISTKTNLITESPIYIMLIIVVIIALIVATMKKIFKELKSDVKNV